MELVLVPLLALFGICLGNPDMVALHKPNIVRTITQLSSSQDVYLHFQTNSSNANLQDVDLQVEKSTSFLMIANTTDLSNFTLLFQYEDGLVKNSSDKLSVILASRNGSVQDNRTYWEFGATGIAPGHVTFLANCKAETNSTERCDASDAFIRFQIFYNPALNVLSTVIGWIYFVAWSISFYPQLILNFQRKSVIGLNFDFVSLNLVGFLCYTAYNVGFFWIPTIKKEFVERNPHDIPPVELNDVIFAIHAVLLTMITVIQIFIYERGDQKLSKVAMGILSACGLAIVIFIILAGVTTVAFNWMDMIQGFSYVKLGITIVKYIPQAWMNFRRKSTVGWSIGNVLLDFTGGTGSIIQMIILAYNFNDWKSIFLNPVKFWLGALSIIFDILFMVQHYILYRKPKVPYSNINSDEET